MNSRLFTYWFIFDTALKGILKKAPIAWSKAWEDGLNDTGTNEKNVLFA